MIRVGMGDEDDDLIRAAHRSRQHPEVIGENRPGIDYGHPAFADDMASSAVEGEAPGIVGPEGPHRRPHFDS